MQTTTRPIANLIRRAMGDPDRYVIEMDYVDSKGVATRRAVSPIRFVGADRMLALCLCREEPRQFYLNRCSGIELCDADNVLMPVPMGGPSLAAIVDGPSDL